MSVKVNYGSIIQLENQNEDVIIGRLIDENSYSRENKHVMIDNTINIVGDIEEINNTEILKNIDELIILNLLLKYIPYKVFEKNAESINYTDTGSLYLFLKKEKNKIFRFFKCSLEKSKISEDYLLSLTQSTFAPEELFLEIEKIS